VSTNKTQPDIPLRAALVRQILMLGGSATFAELGSALGMTEDEVGAQALKLEKQGQCIISEENPRTGRREKTLAVPGKGAPPE